MLRIIAYCVQQLGEREREEREREREREREESEEEGDDEVVVVLVWLEEGEEWGEGGWKWEEMWEGR